MTTAVRTALYPLITAGQSAVRDTERRATPEALRTIDGVLCSLPVNEMDDQADRILHAAIRAVSLAEDAEEWTLLTDVEEGVSRFLHEPDGATMEHPAVRALVLLTSQCGNRYGVLVEDPVELRAWQASPERQAWNRAFLLGLEALRELGAAINGSANRRALDKAMTEFLTSVRRAIPYAALYEARRALVEAARAYGLFVIGMRQPMPTNGRWEWARRIGSATYLFEVEFPHMDGDPYGAVAVRRIAEDGTGAPVRYIPLGPDEERRRAVTEAQYRI
ncbi:hypothetical protein [Streptomyces kronopolitis]|uniref:hypothetical protein n=1 Tax=Streptomyces kronopolitis TaxID=1612435 RepID=UPI003D99D59F